MAIKYPPKPWRDGQRERLLPGIDFMYNAALKNWVPITPGYVSSKQLQENFGVSTVEQLSQKFDAKVSSIDSDIQLSGRIWKTQLPPKSPNKNDVWIDEKSGKTFSYVTASRTWVELNYVG